MFWALGLLLTTGESMARPAYTEGVVLAQFRRGLARPVMAQRLQALGLVPEKLLVRRLNIWKLRVVKSGLSTRAALEQLKRQPDIVAAQLDHKVSLREIPDDPYFSQQWNLNNTGQNGGTPDADIDAPEAWNISTGGTTALGREIVVAVIDGGAELSHNDLVDNIWTNPGEIPDNGVDDDNNGYVDDVHGWNAYTSSGQIQTSSHGTHVSGIIGARGNNNIWVSGINWDVKIMEVAGASTQTSVVLEAYGYVLDQKMDWIESGGTRGAFVVATNSSFGVDYADCNSGEYPLWNTMYDALGEAGILSAAATANTNVNVDEDGDVPTGCSSPYLVTVTNTDKYDHKVTYAGYGALSIDLGAPGTNILSTDLHNGASYKSGTSMASPHVAGAIALMHAAADAAFAQYYENNPAAAALELKTILLSETDSLGSLQGITVTGGRLNVFRAVEAISQWGGPADTVRVRLVLRDTLFTAPNGEHFPLLSFFKEEDDSLTTGTLLQLPSQTLALELVNATDNPAYWSLATLHPEPVELFPGDTVETYLPPAPPGVYVYRDTNTAAWARGAAGLLVIADTLSAHHWHIWSLAERDTAWLENVEEPWSPAQYHPQWFLINGKNAPEIYNDPQTAFSFPLEQPVLLFIGNTGLWPHSLHFHGLRVRLLNRNGLPLPGGQPYLDTVPLAGGTGVLLLLTANTAGEYKVHDQILTNLTANGTYPGGILLQLQAVSGIGP